MQWVSYLGVLAATACSGAKIEVRPAPSPIPAIDDVDIRSGFALDADAERALEAGLRERLPRVPDGQPGARLRVNLERHAHHDEVDIGAHGDRMGYDYVTYEIRVLVTDRASRTLASCQVTWDEADTRVARDPRREERSLSRHLQQAARALLGGEARTPRTLVADAGFGG